MKKLLISLCLLPAFAVANETGESCAKLEDSAKRLECYDSVFLKSPTQEDSELQQKLNEGLAKLETERTSWQYRESKDEMRNKTSYFASKSSNNTLELSFPYQGGSNLILMLRKHSEYGNDVMFSISKGQFACRIDGCNISVKFDEGNVEKYSMGEPESGTNDVLFISGSKSINKFMDKLKKSKKMVIEVPIYDYGRAQFTFDTQGLEWKHF